MKRVKKSVLLWYSAHEMYALVTAVKDYPAFLPWCERAEILESTDTSMTARLHLHYAGVRHAFTTRNVQVPDRSVEIGLVDGPFSLLDGLWQFHPLVPPGQDPASPEAQACRIEFQLDYAFNNRALEAVLSPVFDRVANTFVDSFVRRAEAVYGPR